MAEPDPKSAPLSAEGELVGSFFCVYCGELNPIGVMICRSCRQYIADQGPDLSARLQRIKRYVSTAQARTESPQSGLIGDSVAVRDSIERQSPADEGDDAMVWHLVDVEPIMARITQVASHISPTPRPLGLEFGGKGLWLFVFVTFIFPLLQMVLLLFVSRIW